MRCGYGVGAPSLTPELIKGPCVLEDRHAARMHRDARGQEWPVEEWPAQGPGRDRVMSHMDTMIAATCDVESLHTDIELAKNSSDMIELGRHIESARTWHHQIGKYLDELAEAAKGEKGV